MGKKGTRPAPAKSRRQVMEELDMSHSESEDERLSKQLSKHRKGGDAETDDEDDMEAEEVMGLDDDEDEEEDDDEDEDMDEDEEDDDDDGRLASMARYMEQKVKLQGGLDEDEEEEDEEEAGGKVVGWSKKASDYYGADVGDPEIESDEDALKEEEEEGTRIQRERAEALKAQDFELSEGEDEDEEDSEEEEEAGKQVEVVAKDLDKMTDEEKRAAVERDAPELQSLLAELNGALAEVRHRIAPLLQEVRDGELVTQQGVSYLEAKHLLLLQYCASIVFYLLLKAEGKPVREHPVVLRLVALRGYLEKIRPIDRKLQHQMQKLLQAAKVAAQGGEAAAEDGAEAKEQDFGPRPELLVARAGAAVQEDGQAAAGGGDSAANGVYRPPKINPVSMEDDPDKPTLSRDERRRIVEARRRAARSSMVQEMVQELEGAPEEQRTMVAGFESAAAIRQRQRLEARAAVEEDMFMRVPLSREEVKKLKASRRAGLSGAAVLDDFADEVTDLVEMAGTADGGRSALADLFARHKVSQRFGGDLLDEARAAARNKSGDADLPDRAPLHERRAKYDAVAARRSAAMDGDDEDDDEPRGKRAREEDEFYTAAKEAARAKKSARKEAYERDMLAPPAPEPTTDKSRKITYEIEKNRGLTPHRRKDLKNPRKKHRIKFAQAVVRRKGQVQDVRQDKGGYGGEATGIKSRVTKSRKF